MLAAVSSATCEAANLYVQSQTTEEDVIASAKSVTTLAAKLFVIAQIKVEADSDHHKQLQVAYSAWI